MTMVKWQCVCASCGKGGVKVSRSETAGRPTSSPQATSISGKCPTSLDGKHKPRWEKV